MFNIANAMKTQSVKYNLTQITPPCWKSGCCKGMFWFRRIFIIRYFRRQRETSRDACLVVFFIFITHLSFLNKLSRMSFAMITPRIINKFLANLGCFAGFPCILIHFAPLIKRQLVAVYLTKLQVNFSCRFLVGLGPNRCKVARVSRPPL